jgi:hypothetical protein
MTVALNEPNHLSTLISKFRDIPEIDKIEERPINNINPKLLKKAMSIPKMQNKPRATLFVTLENI